MKKIEKDKMIASGSIVKAITTPATVKAKYNAGSTRPIKK